MLTTTSGTLLLGLSQANSLRDTLVVAPRFASNFGTNCRDTLALHELNWNCLQAPEGWRVGGPAIDNSKIAAFDAIDEILRKLAQKGVFPNLKAIVVAGHSGGGQFVQRYQLHQPAARESRRCDQCRGKPVELRLPRQLAADAQRNSDERRGCLSGQYAPPSAKPQTPFTEYADARNCTGYDAWPYGLTKRSGYVASLTDEQLKKRVAARHTTYLLGELDILPLYGFDTSCSAAAQGPTRLARGLAYAKYENEMTGAAQDARHRSVRTQRTMHVHRGIRPTCAIS